MKQSPTAFWKLTPSEQPAFVHSDGACISYAELAQNVDAFAERLRADRGPIALFCDGSYRQYVAYLGALNAGCPVLLMEADQSVETCSIALKYTYAAQEDRLTQHSNGADEWHPDLAVLLSTSGSTGAAKWVRLSFANLSANAQSICEYLALGPADRAPMALPFQYSYGMSIVNSHLATGASLVLVEGSVVDADFWKTFARTGCTSLAGVPHSFELMQQAKTKTDHLKNLRYMTQAGGRLDAQQVKDWSARGRKEGWDFFVMYGQTEAAPRISYLPPQMARDTPSAIGIPVPGGELWVADTDGNPVSDGAQGELYYRGPNTMMGYATTSADLAKPQGSDILKTGDLARRLSNGGFEIVGRMSRFVKVFGLRISLDEVEKTLSEKAIDAACVAKGDTLYVVLANEPADRARKVTTELAEWLKIPASSFYVITTEALPRQASGKVDLRALEVLVEGLDTQDTSQNPPTRGFLSKLLPRRRSTIPEVFRAHFPNDRVTPQASFNSLGGDSLSYVAVSLELESLMGQLPAHWANMQISQLEKADNSGELISYMDTPTLIRALSIMLIVAGHLALWDYGGGGPGALFMVAGIAFVTFTMPQISQRATVWPIVTLALRIALITFAYTLLNLLATGYGEWPALVFIGNWISPDTQGSAWFIEVYLQLLAIVALIFALPKVRQLSVDAPFMMSVLMTAAFVGMAALSDLIIDTHHLFRRLPHIFGWMFFLGMACATAKTVMEKGSVTAIMLIGLWQFGSYETLFVQVQNFFPLAALVLIWVPAVPIPRITTGLFRMVAGASLFIYLTHFSFAQVSTRVFGDSSAMAWTVAICGGVIAWRFYDRVEASVRKHM